MSNSLHLDAKDDLSPKINAVVTEFNKMLKVVKEVDIVSSKLTETTDGLQATYTQIDGKNRKVATSYSIVNEEVKKLTRSVSSLSTAEKTRIEKARISSIQKQFDTNIPKITAPNLALKNESLKQFDILKQAMISTGESSKKLNLDFRSSTKTVASYSGRLKDVSKAYTDFNHSVNTSRQAVKNINTVLKESKPFNTIDKEIKKELGTIQAFKTAYIGLQRVLNPKADSGKVVNSTFATLKIQLKEAGVAVSAFQTEMDANGRTLLKYSGGIKSTEAVVKRFNDQITRNVRAQKLFNNAKNAGSQRAIELSTQAYRLSQLENQAIIRKTNSSIKNLRVLEKENRLAKETALTTALKNKVSVARAVPARTPANAKAENFKSEISSQHALRAAIQETTQAWKKRTIVQRQATNSSKRDTQAIKKQTNRTKEMLVSWHSVIRLFTVQLAHRAIAAFTSAVREGITELINLEKKLSEIQTISQGSQVSFLGWQQSLKGLSDQFGIEQIKQAEAAYQALSNQVTNGADTFTFLASANKLAVTTISSTEESVNILTAAINAFGLSVADSDKISASLFKTIELGRVRLSEMQSSLGRIGVPAAKLGISLHELEAAISSTTVQGITFQESSTLIRNILLKLIKPSKGMSDLFKSMGVNSGEMAIKTFGLAGVLQKVEDATHGSTTELGKLFGRLRAITGALLFSGKSLDRYKSNLREIENATKSYGKAFDLVMKTTGKKFEIEMNKIKNFFINNIGKSLLETISTLTFGFKGLTFVVKEFASALTGLALVGAVAGLTKLALIISGLSAPILAASAAVAVLSVALGKLLTIHQRTLSDAQDVVIQYRKIVEKETLQAKIAFDKLNDSIDKNLKKQTQNLLREQANQLAILNAHQVKLNEVNKKNETNLKKHLEIIKTLRSKDVTDNRKSQKELEALISKNKADRINNVFKGRRETLNIDIKGLDLSNQVSKIDAETSKLNSEISIYLLDQENILTNVAEIEKRQSAIASLDKLRLRLIDTAYKKQKTLLEQEEKIKKRIADAEIAANKKIFDLRQKQQDTVHLNKANEKAFDLIQKTIKAEEKLKAIKLKAITDISKAQGKVSGTELRRIKRQDEIALRKAQREKDITTKKVFRGGGDIITILNGAREEAKIRIASEKKIKDLKDNLVKNQEKQSKLKEAEKLFKAEGDFDKKRQARRKEFEQQLVKVQQVAQKERDRLIDKENALVEKRIQVNLLTKDLLKFKAGKIKTDIGKASLLVKQRQERKPLETKLSSKIDVTTYIKLQEQLDNLKVKQEKELQDLKLKNIKAAFDLEFSNMAKLQKLELSKDTKNTLDIKLKNLEAQKQIAIDTFKIQQQTQGKTVNLNALIKYKKELTDTLIKQQEVVKRTKEAAVALPTLLQGEADSLLFIQIDNTIKAAKQKLRDFKIIKEQVKNLTTGKIDKTGVFNLIDALGTFKTSFSEDTKTYSKELENIKIVLDSLSVPKGEKQTILQTAQENIIKIKDTLNNMPQDPLDTIFTKPQQESLKVESTLNRIQKLIKDIGNLKVSPKIDIQIHRIENVSQSQAKARGGILKHFARGTDTVLASLTPGEMVMNRGAVRQYGSQLTAMNRGSQDGNRMSTSNNFSGDFNISLTPTGNTEIDVLHLGRLLKREIRRGAFAF